MTQKSCIEAKFSERINQVPRSFIRDILKSATNKEIISFAGGLPNKKYFPAQALARSAARVLHSNPNTALQYSLSFGLPELREIISSFYNSQGINIPVENILITTGSQQALDLIGKVFINPADKIIIEEPSYLGAIQAFSMYNPVFKPIELNYDGINIEKWKEAICNSKFTYLISNFQNPSGVTYSNEKRKEIASYAKKTDSLIIEDDPYGKISFEDNLPPNIYTYAPDNTILLGSFSKMIVPGFRIGWIIANNEIINKLETAKQAADLHTNVFSQCVVIDFLKNNNIAEHLQKVTTAYKKQAMVMFECIDKYFGEEVKYTRSKGGMFTWATMPEGFSSIRFFEKALKRNVAFIPGVPFYINKNDVNTLRLNFSCCEPEDICKGIKIMAEIYNETY